METNLLFQALSTFKAGSGAEKADGKADALAVWKRLKEACKEDGFPHTEGNLLSLDLKGACAYDFKGL